MNAEIERYLSTLRDYPKNSQALQSLEASLVESSSLSEEVLAALDRSCKYHWDHGHWDMVLTLIDLQLSSALDKERRIQLLRQKGQLLEEELLDEEAALQVFREIVLLNPDDSEAQDTLEQIELMRSNWEKVVSRLVEEATSSVDRQVATRLFLDAAETSWRNQASDEQIEGYLRRSLEIDPQNRKANLHLERLFKRQNRYQEVIAVLEQRVDVATNREERQNTLLALGNIWYRQLKNPTEALNCYRRALSISPIDQKVLQLMVEMLTEQQDWPALIRLYEEILRARPSTEQELGTLLQIGILYYRKLQQPEPAEEYFRRVRKADPLHPVMLDFYREYYRSHEEPVKILALLDAAQRAENDPAIRIKRIKEMAKVSEEEVGNLEKAIDIWKSIQRTTPQDTDSIIALKRLYRLTQPPKWNALRELLKDELERLGEDQVEEKIQLLLEIADIYREHLKLDVMVVNTYNAILALKPDHSQVLEALAVKYESMGRWNDLISLLWKTQEIQTADSDKISTLHRIASLWLDKFANQSQAIKPLEEILRLDPINDKALTALREIYIRRRNWRELIELYRLESAHREITQRRAIYKEMASIAAEKLGDMREGIQVWNRILEEDPYDAEALAELTLLYQKEERWVALIEVLHRQVAICKNTGETDKALSFLQQLGEIYTHRVNAIENAIQVWREVLDLNPDSTLAKNLLRDLYVAEGRWDDLEQLMIRFGEYAEIAETLSAAADRNTDNDIKIKLYSRVGEIYSANLNQPDRAMKAYERVMLVDPDNMAAAQALIPLYQTSERWSRLLAIYEIIFQQKSEIDEKLDIVQEICQLCEMQLGSKVLAFEWCTKAYALAPEALGRRAELERLAAESDRWEDLVNIYDEYLSKITEPESKAAMLQELARLCIEKLRRPEKAEGYFQALLQIHPDDRPSLDALEHIYASFKKWEELVGIYRKRLELEENEEHKAELLLKVAFIHEERLGTPAGAIESLNELIQLQPDNLRGLRSLDRLYQVGSDWLQLANILQQEFQVLKRKEEKVEILVRLGDIYQKRLHLHEQAVDIFTQVLSFDPVNRAAIHGLEVYLSLESALRFISARVLQPFYERTESWANLIKVLEVQLETEEDVQAKISFHKRLMFINSKRLSNEEAAFKAGAQVLLLVPEDFDLRREMMALADRLNKVDELVKLLVTALAQIGPEQHRVEVALRWELGNLLDERLGRPDEAETHFRRVLELEPRHSEAMNALERILRDSSKWIELRSLLERRKELTDSANLRRDILIQISMLNEDVLSDEAAAIKAYEEILELEPDHGMSIKALERHYASTSRWEDLVHLLRREMDLVGDAEALNSLKLRQAEIWAQNLNDPSAATDLVEEVVALEPNSPRAVILLENLLEQEELKARVAEILQTVYSRQENWAELVRILMIRRSLTTEPLSAIDFLCQAAVLYEDKLQDPVNAFETYREALVICPADTKVQEAVYRLAVVLSAWPEAVSTWEEALRATDPMDRHLQSVFLMRLATALDQQLNDAKRAKEAFEQLLNLDPTCLEMAQPAANALVRLYEQDVQWTDLIRTYRHQLSWTTEPKTRHEILLRISQLQEEKLEQTSDAVSTFHEILEETPDSLDALAALERIYLREQQWAELIEIYRRYIALASSVDERRNYLHKIATNYEINLNDPEQAISAYLMVLDDLPEDLDSLRALERIYRGAERWTDLLEMLERELRISEGETRINLLFETASLQHHYLADKQSAIERYQEILSEQPGHLGVRQALEELLQDTFFQLIAGELLCPIYQAEGNWERLIEVYELQAQQTAENTAKIQLLQAIARLAEESLHDLERAFAAYRRTLFAAVAESELLPIVQELQRLARLQNQWPNFIQALETAVGEILDPQKQKAVHLIIAQVSLEELRDFGRAQKHYLQVLDLDPDEQQALEALDNLYTVLERWDDLSEILARRIEITTDEGQQRSFLIRSAVINQKYLGRLDDAIARYEQVLRLIPTDVEAIAALEILYPTMERWPDLARHLEHRLNIVEQVDDRVHLYYRMGELKTKHLDDAAGAIDSYREVLALDPGYAGAITALEVFLEDSELRVDAARILEPIYAGQQNWLQLVRIYQIRLEAAEDADRRLALSVRIAQLYEEQLEDLESAFTWYGKVFLENAADSGNREQLLRLAGILDRWSDVAGFFNQYLDRTLEENETARSVALLLGKIYDERLAEVDGAIKCYQRVLEANRLDVEAFHLLESLLTRAERWQELLVIYQEAANVSGEVDERRELLLKICRVWEEALENLPEAIDAYKAILDLRENDREAIAALERLYSETNRWLDLCELLNYQCNFIESNEEIIELKYRLGMVYELRLEDLPFAIDHYEEVLNRDPFHTEALTALERLVLDREQRFRIARILEPIYRQQDEWAKLVVIYDAQLDFIEDKDRRIFLLKEIARLHEERDGSLELAFKALARAFQEEPTNWELLEEVERLARKLQNWLELVQVLESAAEGIYDPDLAARILTKVAVLYEDHLNQSADAIDAWRKVLKAQDANLEAIDALIRLLDQLGIYEDEIEILTRKVEVLDDLAERKATYYRVAEIYESLLVQPDRAIDVYQQILVLDEQDRFALSALDRLYLMASNWLELIGVYRRVIEISSDLQERRLLYLAVAEVYEDKLENNFEAITVYKELLELDQQADPNILESLDRLYTKESLHADLLDIIEKKIQLESSPERQIELIFRAAVILENEIGDLDGAISRYQQVIEREHAHPGSREALDRLVHTDSHRDVVVPILERLYGSTGEIKPLVEVLELKLIGAVDLATRRDLLLRIGSLHEENLNDKRAAFSALSRALSEDPTSEEVQRNLDRLANELGIIAELVEVYERRLAAIYDAILSRQIHLKVAVFLEEGLNEPLRAAKHYHEALDCGGEELFPLQALDRIYEAQGNQRMLLEILLREVQIILEPMAQAELYFRIGKVYMLESDWDGAFGAFRQSLELDPNHNSAAQYLEQLLDREMYRVAVLDILEPFYERKGDFNKVISLLEIRLSILFDSGERAMIHERVANYYERDLALPDQALNALGRAIVEDPLNLHFLHEAERIADSLSGHDQLAAIIDTILSNDIPAEVARILGLQAAQWYINKLNQYDKAEWCYHRILEFEPDNAAALDGLQHIFRFGAKPAELTQVLWKQAEIELDVNRRRALLAEIAQLNTDILANIPGAIAAWQEIVNIDQCDTEALGALSKLYESIRDWENYLDILDRQSINAGTVEEQVDFKYRAGEIYIAELDNLDRAVAIYRDILDISPYEARVLTALEAIYTQQEDWKSLHSLLLHRLESYQGKERIPIYLHLAEICSTKLHDIDEAAGYYHQVLLEEPHHLDAIYRLEQMLQAEEKWYDLIDVLRRHATILAEQGNTIGEIDQLVAASRIWNEKIQNPDAAAELLEEILQRDQQNVTALLGLVRLYESTQQWQRCRDVLLQAATLNSLSHEAAEIEYHLGKVELGQGQNEDKAIEHFIRALAITPEYDEAALALEELSRNRKEWDRLVDLLDVRVLRVPENEREKIFIELGKICIQQIAQPERGIKYLEKIREQDPDNLEILTLLADAYFALELYEAAEPLLQKVVELIGRRRGKDLAQYTYRMGAIAERKGAMMEAREYYDQAYRMDSTYGPTLVALGRIYYQAADWQNVRRIYRSMLLQNMDENAGITKADIFYYLGQAHAELGERAKALSMFERGLEVDSSHSAIIQAIQKLKN